MNAITRAQLSHIQPLSHSLLMRFRVAATVLAVTALVAGCRADTNVTDPNEPSTGSFWTSAAGALQGINATYNSLIRLGTFQRRQAFSQQLYIARMDNP